MFILDVTVVDRGAPICKITDISITDILAMKITNSDQFINHVVSLLKTQKYYTEILICCYDIYKIVHTCIYETDWLMKHLPICQYYRYQCHINASVMDFTDVLVLKIWPILTDTDINIGASLVVDIVATGGDAVEITTGQVMM